MRVSKARGREQIVVDRAISSSSGRDQADSRKVTTFAENDDNPEERAVRIKALKMLNPTECKETKLHKPIRV